jgi:DNA segregation ATPase FtsK/SpoIIIE, S-DNA-T family
LKFIRQLREAAPELKDEIQIARTLPEKFAFVPDVPITAHLAVNGAIGITGSRPEILQVARAMICRMAAHHWFSEVQAAALGEPVTLADWGWIAGLPHNAKAIPWQKAAVNFSDPASCAIFLDLEKELRRRDQVLEARKMVSGDAVSKAPLLPALILILDSFPLDFSHPGLDFLMKKGKSLGVYVLYLTSAPAQVPGECGAVINITNGNLTYREAIEGGVSLDCRPDQCDISMAEGIAHALAKMDWCEKEDLSQPPSMITFLNMFMATTTEELPVEQWWDNGSPFGFLQAPIGKTSATSEFIFDLRDQDGSHGPHGLLGGMTGSGKSEVLKSLILALAVTCHPHDLNFALVDYKGGAAFNELAKLPHTVGVMTDIESHASYAERVLRALTGEMERRKRILERARSTFRFGRSHVDDYRTMRVRQPLPHLVLVFDEFAEFKNKYPEESKRLISIARLGRSLGVHLILATQNIQAAIDPQIMQNSNFRICLRTAQPEDSIQMIGIPDAIQLARGRAYFYSHGRQQVQIAYCGGKYLAAEDQVRTRQVVVVQPDGRKETFAADADPMDSVSDGPGDGSLTEASAVVERLNWARANLQLKKPDPVWTNPLPESISLSDLWSEHFTGGWNGHAWHASRKWGDPPDPQTRAAPVLGLCDLPQQQRQSLLQISMEEGGGHILVFGSAGSGKTTLLKTLTCAIAQAYSPGAAQIYILDYGAQAGLELLSEFPHVGSVINRFEPERADRMVRFIKGELRRRNELFRHAGVGSIDMLNSRRGQEEFLPEIFLMIDNFLGLKRAFDAEYTNEITNLVGAGGSCGIHLAITSFLPSDLPSDLVTNVHTQVTFHQATPSDYFSTVGTIPEARVQEDDGRPPRAGRGFLRSAPPIEWQAALPATGATDQERLGKISETASAMRRAWKGALPNPIESLPFSIPLPKIPGNVTVSPIGIGALQGKDFETLLPIGFDLEKDGPAFLITSSAGQSGKTTALITWALALAEKYSPNQLRFILLDFHTRTLTALQKLPHTQTYIRTAVEEEPGFLHLLEELQKRAIDAEAAYLADPDGFDPEPFLAGYPRYVLLIDDYDRFAVKCEAERRMLADCYTAGAENGMYFFIAGNAADLPKDYDDPFLQKTRRLGSGLLFSGNAAIEQFNNAKSPPYQPLAGLPAGRGYFIRKGHTRIFQNYTFCPECQKPTDGLLQRVECIRNQYLTQDY